MDKSKNKVNPFEDVAAKMPALVAAFKRFVRKQVYAFPKDLRDIAKTSLEPRGKFIRPLLVFSAAGYRAKKSENLVRRAAIAELIHLSTLIHDDVIDNANVRRNSVTPNKKYGAHGAILLGDAIFARTMQLAYFENDNELLGKLANCVRTICEGEMEQTLVNLNRNISRRQYFKTVYGKTGVLFETACLMGAECAECAGENWSTTTAEVGKQLGIAYQIYDDVCDWFMSEADAGKTLGTDLISGKHTFPLIALFEKLPKNMSVKLDKNLTDTSPAEISDLMFRFDIASACKSEFDKRVGIAEKRLAPFGEDAHPLLDFCASMRNLRFT